MDVRVGAENSSFTDCQCFFGGSNWIALNQFFHLTAELEASIFSLQKAFLLKEQLTITHTAGTGFRRGVVEKMCPFWRRSGLTTNFI